MDVAPIPCICENSIPKNESKIKEEKDYIIISDKNNSFHVNFSNYSNFIKIKAYLKYNDLENKNYEKLYYLNELKNNKFLSICDSIDEVYQQLIYELNKNSKKNIIEEKNKINIIIPVEHIKIKEIKFILFEQKKTDKELIQELFIKIKNLNEEINELKNENKKINEKNTYLEAKTEKILEKLNSLQEYLDLNNKIDLNKSKIINNDNIKQDSIIKWIKESINKNKIKFELIFQMSKDGSNSEDFHKLCDNKGPTLVLIKTTKNRIFGGFTPLNWNKDKGSAYDKLKQTFIFSLNLMKKYNMIDNQKEAIICNTSGPIFGCDDIYIKKNMKEGETYANEFCNFLTENNLELTGGKGNDESFNIEEFEVFKVIY